MSDARPLLLWGPVAAYVAFIFWISSAYRPVPGIEIFPQMDKVFHALEYAPLGVLLARALRRSFSDLRWGQVLPLALTAALVVAGLDEWYQSFVPMKEAAVLDFLFDGVGAAAGEWLYRRRTASTP